MRRVVSLLAAAVIAGAALLANAAPASADSGWRCRHIGGGELCFRTLKKDRNHIRGADISYNKIGTVNLCVTIRFGHLTVGDHGDYLYHDGLWLDDGQFQICGSQVRSYYWSHAGNGARVSENGQVVGFIQIPSTQERIYTVPIHRSNI
jgi:hypothetical protein